MAKRSAIESVPGRDALLEYEEKSYPIKTYVERNGLIYKSVSATSETFIPSQWELVADLRDVRVPDIAARNSLTGNTGFIYGVHTPIIDNTNVLVLDASADPQVGVVQFARYNYNELTASWLILQVGTGATSASTSIEYANVLNRPSVLSGVTVNAGAGLTGGGAVIGGIPAAGGAVTVSHADTSSQANLTPSGRTYIQELRVDGFGHVTGATQSTWTHPDTSSQPNVLNTGRTYIQSISVDGDGHVSSIASSPWTHPDTSTQANSVNAGQTFIQSVYLDGDGHVTNIVTGVAAGGGGGSSPLTYNGDSGGALTMNSGTTLTISGGSNIQTVRSGNAAVPGLRINFNPPGLNTEIPFNNSGVLGTHSNLNWINASQLLRTANLNILSTPTSGLTTNDILTRAASGLVTRLGMGTITNLILNNLTANNGITRTGNNFRLGGALTGSTTISGAGLDLFFTNRSWTFGTRSGTTGTNSFVFGTNNIAQNSNSIAVGAFTQASGMESFAQNRFTRATGTGSHAGGQGLNSDFNKYIIAGGIASFNHSQNSSLQTAGHGANAVASAILGGINHNIESTNTNAVILGGDSIKLTGTTYIDHTAVANLAIMTAPALGIGADDVLVRSSTTGRIRRVTQASLAGGGGGTPAGSSGQVQYNAAGAFGASPNFTFATGSSTLVSTNIGIGAVPTIGTLSDNILLRNTGTGVIERIATSTLASAIGTANNGLTKIGGNYVLGGALTGNTTISGLFTLNLLSTSVLTNILSVGPRLGTLGNNTLTVGFNNTANFNNAVAFGNGNVAGALQAAAFGQLTVASGTSSFSTGSATKATGIASFATGGGSIASAIRAHAEGFNTIASADSSHAEGNGSTASGVYAHAEGQGSIASGSTSHAEGIITKAGGQGSHAEGSQTFASGDYSHAEGNLTYSRGSMSHTGGFGFSSARPVLALGQAAFNHSISSGSQVIGHGANATASAILGGQNHNIESGNTNAVILGSATIKLTGNTYANYTAVGNLAIMTAPPVGVSTDDVLIRRGTNGRIHRVTQASLVAASNGVNKVGTTIRLGGALTGNTTISGVGFDLFFTNRSLTLGTRSGVVGNNSLVIGTGQASGSTSIAIAGGLAVGNSTIASGSAKAFGDGSIALGFLNESHGQFSFSSGNNNRANGNYSFAVGVGSLASGVGAFASGTIFSIGTPRLLASGQASFNHSYNSAVQSVGAGATAFASAILGGQDHNIASGNTNAVIIGGSSVNLTGTSYINHTAVSNLAIRSLPAVGINTDDVLVRRSTTGKILRVTQASISDERLKKNLEPLTGVLDKIDKLSTVEFQYNEKNQPELHDRKDYGLIAQEVEELYPYVVNDNLTIEGDARQYKTVEYRKLVPILFAAIKELRAEINQLKNNNSCGDCKCHG